MSRDETIDVLDVGLNTAQVADLQAMFKHPGFLVFTRIFERARELAKDAPFEVKREELTDLLVGESRGSEQAFGAVLACPDIVELAISELEAEADNPA